MLDLVKRSAITMAGFLLVVLTCDVFVATGNAEAKTPGSKYCFVGKCHRVKTLSQTASLVGKTIPLYASHYSHCKKDRYNPCGLTSSGEEFHPDRPDNAASPIYPDGTVLLVRNPATKAAVVLRINNAGPYWGKRKLDVSFAAAEKLGFRKRGVAKLETKILAAPNKREARYSRKRKYRPVPGFIGKFDSLKTAEATAVALMVLDATAASALAPSSSAAIAVAARTESRRQKARKRQDKKRLEPILRSMNLIAELKPVAAKELRTAGVAIKAAPNWAKAHLRKPVSVAAAASTPGVESGASAGDGHGSSPSKGLALAALADAGSDLGVTEMRSTRTAVKLIKTAEVGEPAKDDWAGLLRPRLGGLSLLGGHRGLAGEGSPFRPLPGRAPRPALPYAPNTARYGVTG